MSFVVKAFDFSAHLRLRGQSLSPLTTPALCATLASREGEQKAKIPSPNPMNAALIRHQVEATLARRIPSALTPRPAFSPPTMPIGIAQVDALTGGFPRGGLTEICGPTSSGRTSLLISFIAQLTQAGEVCTLIDSGNAFDPHSAAQAGVVLPRLLWVRCGNSPAREEISNDHHEIFAASIKLSPKLSPLFQSRATPLRTHDYGVNNREGNIARELTKAVNAPSPQYSFIRGNNSRNPAHKSALEQALKAADLLLESGGFGAVILDLGDTPTKFARRVPLTSWFRFRRTVEHTDTALVVLEEESNAKTCASLVLQLSQTDVAWARTGDEASPGHPSLLHSFSTQVEVIRSRLQLPERIHTFSIAQTGALFVNSMVQQHKLQHTHALLWMKCAT